MTLGQGQCLHWVFKVADLRKNVAFYTQVLGMSLLRHEEFNSGCDAQCNGAYSRPWSKTIIGYGDEKDHFVFELTFNYGIRGYEKGNDFGAVLINHPAVLENASGLNYPVHEDANGKYLLSPDGNVFRIMSRYDPSLPHVFGIQLFSNNLSATKRFYTRVLSMHVANETNDTVSFTYPSSSVPFVLNFHHSPDPISHAKAYGRLAIAAPLNALGTVEDFFSSPSSSDVNDRGTILVPRVRLDTPGKATVEVIILGDNEGYEICVVGEEAFFELAKREKVMIEWEKRCELGTNETVDF